MAAAAVTSAAPFLALLEEEDDALKVHALQQLDGLVSQFWYQISNYIPTVEALSEDDEFGSREKASLLASKVHSSLTQSVDCHKCRLGTASKS
jgi:26S proteasome regulatory subunit N2